MAEKSWNPGDVLTASDLNKWATPLVAVTSGDVSSVSASVVTDPTLVLTADINATYDVDFYAVFDGPSSNGVNCWFTGPAGAVLSLWFAAQAASVPGIAFTEVGLGSAPGIEPISTQGTGTNMTTAARGTLVTGGTAGNLQFVFTQNVSSGTATRRRARSRLILRRIG